MQKYCNTSIYRDDNKGVCGMSMVRFSLFEDWFLLRLKIDLKIDLPADSLR